jgi:hypothetical protein
MNQNQSQKSLANVCLFCGEGLKSPSMCRYCGFKFCDQHKATEDHQCIKTRYSEYIRSNQGKLPNISTGHFRVVCEMCGFTTSKGVPIEYAGEELVQHTQIVGCTDKIFLEEVNDANSFVLNPASNVPPLNDKIRSNHISDSNPHESNSQSSIVDQIIRLSSLREKGMISDEEFSFIKKELIKKLQSI